MVYNFWKLVRTYCQVIGIVYTVQLTLKKLGKEKLGVVKLDIEKLSLVIEKLSFSTVSKLKVVGKSTFSELTKFIILTLL